MLNRREMLRRTGATAALALGASAFPLGWTAAGQPRREKKRLFMYTRSQTFVHPVINRMGNDLSLAECVVTELALKHNFRVHCTKDGREFLPENIGKYDAFFFETTGDLTREGGDNEPPMPPEGKAALLDAIANGKGFLGSHCASDTFHSKGKSTENQAIEQQDPYIQMIGGEFIVHGAQQKAAMRVVDHAFPGAKDNSGLKGDAFTLNEEWYALKNFSPDLHVILVQDTEGMKGGMYERPSFPATWARMHKKGRVFYTSMGHREDVWENPLLKDLLAGALAWAFGLVEADVTPNIATVTPQAAELRKPVS